MVSPPAVSIITAVSSSGELLPETIHSVLGQDYGELQYILVHQASTRLPQQTLQQYGSRLVQHPMPTTSSSGRAAMVNAGLALAEGEIVCLLQAGDLMFDGAVQAGVQALATHPEAVVAYCDWVAVDRDGLIRAEHRTPLGSLRELLLSTGRPAPCAFYRRSLLDELGGLETSLPHLADRDLWLRLALRGPWLHLPRLFAGQRESLGQPPQGPAGPRAEEHLAVLRRFFDRPDLPAELLEARAQAFSSAYHAAGCETGLTARQRLGYFARSLHALGWRDPAQLSMAASRILAFLLGRWRPWADLRGSLLELRQATPWKGKHYSLILGEAT
jgi:hypothetical protein